MYMKTDDNELALRAGGGDAAAFEVLLERHYLLIFRIALRFVGLREDAEDLAQEICVSLGHKLRLFKGEARFTTWLYRVVINAARDLKRKQQTAGRMQQNYSEFLELLRGEQAEAAENQAWLYETLDELGGDLRETAVLVLAEGLSHAEAAEILGLKESTISWRMSEMRKKLKALVDRQS